MISKELLSEVFGQRVISCNINKNEVMIQFFGYDDIINIYELAHKNLKQWAKLKNIFDIIDWSEEPEQIFKKVEKIRNEIN